KITRRSFLAQHPGGAAGTWPATRRTVTNLLAPCVLQGLPHGLHVLDAGAGSLADRVDLPVLGLDEPLLVNGHGLVSLRPGVVQPILPAAVFEELVNFDLHDLVVFDRDPGYARAVLTVGGDAVERAVLVLPRPLVDQSLVEGPGDGLLRLVHGTGCAGVPVDVRPVGLVEAVGPNVHGLMDVGAGVGIILRQPGVLHLLQDYSGDLVVLDRDDGHHVATAVRIREPEVRSVLVLRRAGGKRHRQQQRYRRNNNTQTSRPFHPWAPP